MGFVEELGTHVTGTPLGPVRGPKARDEIIA